MNKYTKQVLKILTLSLQILTTKMTPPVYDGCNKGLLSFVVQLLEWKVVGGVTDEAFNSLLKLLREELKLIRLPLNDYEAKLKLSSFGLSYNRIDACKCDKMIYYKGTATRTSCAQCGVSRYKPGKENTPWKVLRHFPIIPQILRSLKSSTQAPLFNGYKESKSSDNLWRVPSDSQAWQHIDQNLKFEDIKSVNVHIGVALDGFNPYKSLSTKWSTWAVTVLNYNLPPTLITKPLYMMLALIVPGKKQVQNINVYLQPLIDEYQELWKGVDGIDVSRPIGELFWCFCFSFEFFVIC